MPKTKKSWTEKLAGNKDLPRVEKISEKMSRKWGKGTVVIPSPMEVAEMMRKVPKGRLVTINDIREALACMQKGSKIGYACVGVVVA